MRLSPGHRTATLTATLLASVAGCAPADRMQTVVQVPCGGGELEIRESVHRGGLPGDRADFQLQLRYRAGPDRSFRQVDRAPKRTPIYSKLYAPAARYVALIDESNVPWSAAERERFAWDVFVSPHDFSKEEYERITTCLRRERDTLQRALGTPRAPFDRFDTVPERSPSLTSIVNLDYDFAYRPCEPHSVSRTFVCPVGETFLQVNPPNVVQLCAPDTEQDMLLGSTVGRLRSGQEVLEMRPPRDLRIAVAARQPRDWLDFYRSCEDGTGASIAGYFQLQSWVADADPDDGPSVPILPLDRLMHGTPAAPTVAVAPAASTRSTTVD